jgi:hypothetical protein
MTIIDERTRLIRGDGGGFREATITSADAYQYLLLTSDRNVIRIDWQVDNLDGSAESVDVIVKTAPGVVTDPSSTRWKEVLAETAVAADAVERASVLSNCRSVLVGVKSTGAGTPSPDVYMALNVVTA